MIKLLRKQNYIYCLSFTVRLQRVNNVKKKNNFHKLVYVISLVNQQLLTELFIVKILSFYQKRDPFPTPS